MMDNSENDLIKKIYSTHKKKIKRKVGLYVISFVVILIFVFCTAGFFVTALSRYVVFKTVMSIMPSEHPTVRVPPPTNILLLGYDEGNRSDSIMVVHVNPKNNEVNLVSIPRDTYVLLPGRGMNKINAASAYGGPSLSKATVENFLKIKIPYYLTVNTGKLARLIDQIGGVTLNVERRFYYTDRVQGLYINLYPGVQKLNGYNSLAYMRFRHDDSDIYRVGRQQKFLEALGKQLLKKENIVKSPQLILKILSSLDTNIGERKVFELFATAKNTITSGHIHGFTLAGRGTMINKGYYMMPNEKYVNYIVEHYLK